MAGCILTEVEDDAKGGAKKGKQLYSFWIVWPQSEEDKKNPKDDEYLSDDDDERDPSKEHHAAKPKDLKEVFIVFFSSLIHSFCVFFSSVQCKLMM